MIGVGTRVYISVVGVVDCSYGLNDRPTDQPTERLIPPPTQHRNLHRWRWQRFPLLLLARLVVYPIFLAWWALTLPVWLPLRLLRSGTGGGGDAGRQGQHGAKKSK